MDLKSTLNQVSRSSDCYQEKETLALSPICIRIQVEIRLNWCYITVRASSTEVQRLCRCGIYTLMWAPLVIDE